MSAPLSSAAVTYGQRAAAKLLQGRTGHANTKGVVYRQLGRVELETICAAAFEMGRTFERQGGSNG